MHRIREKWEFYKGLDGLWHSRFIAANGKILFVSSEGYHNRNDMLEAISILEHTVARAFTTDSVVDHNEVTL